MAEIRVTRAQIGNPTIPGDYEFAGTAFLVKLDPDFFTEWQLAGFPPLTCDVFAPIDGPQYLIPFGYD